MRASTYRIIQVEYKVSDRNVHVAAILGAEPESIKTQKLKIEFVAYADAADKSEFQFAIVNIYWQADFVHSYEILSGLYFIELFYAVSYYKWSPFAELLNREFSFDALVENGFFSYQVVNISLLAAPLWASFMFITVDF